MFDNPDLMKLARAISRPILASRTAGQVRVAQRSSFVSRRGPWEDLVCISERGCWWAVFGPAVDGCDIHFAPKRPWTDTIPPVNTKQVFFNGFKLVQDFVHPQKKKARSYSMR